MGRTIRTALCGALGLALFGGGCGPEASRDGERVGSASSAIQGGKSDTTHGFAMAVCGGAPGGPGAGLNCLYVCGGTLIAPNLVLSARHCVDTVSSPTITCSGDAFGGPLYPKSELFVTTDPDMLDSAATWYSVAEVVTPTQTAFCDNDLALFVLSKSVPPAEAKPVTPDLWYPIYAPPFSGNVTTLGYGLDAPNDPNSWGTRRILSGVSVYCVPGDPQKAMSCAPPSQSGVGEWEFLAGNGLCEGDSGSGAFDARAFAAGDYHAVGVLSRGGMMGDSCQGAVYTQLWPWQDFIAGTAKRAAALGGYATPSWATRPATADGGPPAPPPEDAGNGDDAGDAADAASLPPGASCASGAACATGDCLSAYADAGTVCADPCSDAGTCASGFACDKGYCFVAPDGGFPGQPGSSGCDAAPSGGREGGWIVGLGLGLVAATRKRRAARDSRRATP